MTVRVRSPAPSRSKLCIACSDFFEKSERTHAAAPPFQPRPACAGLASDGENGSVMDCLSAPIKRGGQSLLFFIGIAPDANPFRCRCPVDICCHQFKNRWLLYSFAERNWHSSPVTGTVKSTRKQLFGCLRVLFSSYSDEI